MWYWCDDKQKIRFGNIVNNGCWGIYHGIGFASIIARRKFYSVVEEIAERGPEDSRLF